MFFLVPTPPKRKSDAWKLPFPYEKWKHQEVGEKTTHPPRPSPAFAEVI